jgi:hypothetical protein
MSEHLTTSTISAYRQHLLSEDDTTRVDLHIQACESCASDVLEAYAGARGIERDASGSPDWIAARAAPGHALADEAALANLSRGLRQLLCELLTPAPLHSVACEGGIRFDEWVRDFHACARTLKAEYPELVARTERWGRASLPRAASTPDSVELAFDAAGRTGSCILPGGLGCRLDIAYAPSGLQISLERQGPDELRLLPIFCRIRFRREDEERYLAGAPQAQELAVYRAVWAGADERAWQDTLDAVIPGRRCFFGVSAGARTLAEAPGIPESALLRAERSLLIVNQLRPQLVAAAANSTSRQSLWSSPVDEFGCHVFITRGGDRVYFRISSKLAAYAGQVFELSVGSFSVRLPMVLEESDGQAWGYADASDSEGTLREAVHQGPVTLKLLQPNGQG